jgi:hypothetical protein
VSPTSTASVTPSSTSGEAPHFQRPRHQRHPPPHVGKLALLRGDVLLPVLALDDCTGQSDTQFPAVQDRSEHRGRGEPQADDPNAPTTPASANPTVQSVRSLKRPFGKDARLDDAPPRGLARPRGWGGAFPRPRAARPPGRIASVAKLMGMTTEEYGVVRAAHIAAVARGESPPAYAAPATSDSPSKSLQASGRTKVSVRSGDESCADPHCGGPGSLASDSAATG